MAGRRARRRYRWTPARFGAVAVVTLVLIASEARDATTFRLLGPPLEFGGVGLLQGAPAADGSVLLVQTDTEFREDAPDECIGEVPVGRVWRPPDFSVGDRFQVNPSLAGDRPSDQVRAVSSVADGSFAVGWQTRRTWDGDGPGVFVSITRPGDTLDVHTNVSIAMETLDDQSGLAFDIDPVRGGAAVWRTRSATFEVVNEVRGRRLGSDGLPVGDEFTVAEPDSYGSGSPDVATFADGSFVVVWSQNVRSDDVGEFGEIYAREFDALGVATSAVTRVNQRTRGDQGPATVSAIPGKREYIVSWLSRKKGRHPEFNQQVFVRGFASGVTGTSRQRRANRKPVGADGLVRLGVGASGDVLSVWIGRHGGGHGLFVMPFGEDLRAAQNPVLVDWDGAAGQRGELKDASVVRLRGAEHLLTWGFDARTNIVIAQRVCTTPREALQCGNVTSECPEADDGSADPVDFADVRALLRAATGETWCDPCVCDVDATGVISANDALVLARQVLSGGSITTCPQCSLITR